MSHLTQMAGLTVQNFVSAAVGLAVVVALIRGLIRRRSGTIGNFWVDLTRADAPGPAAPRRSSSAVVLREPGRRPELPRLTDATTTVEGGDQAIPGGPVASQEAIKELGTNGGGPYNANSSIRSRTRTASRTGWRSSLCCSIPFSLTYAYGRHGR